MQYEQRVHIKVKFAPGVAFRVFDELDSEITEDELGNLYTEIALPDDYNLYYYILSFGDGAEVLEPEEIRLKMKEILKNLSEKYKS